MPALKMSAHTKGDTRVTTIDINGLESLDFSHDYDRDGFRHLKLKLTGEDGTEVRIYCGRFADDLESLHSLFEELVTETAGELESWEDDPDPESDGWIQEDRGGYSVSLEGIAVGTFSSRDRAEYELALAMTAAGVFPNLIYCNDRGNTFQNYDSMRPWHDDGGTDMIPNALERLRELVPEDELFAGEDEEGDD